MTSTSLRTLGTAAITTALLGAGAFLGPAVAQAQFDGPLTPEDLLKIDSPYLTSDVRGTTAHLTLTAPEGLTCLGPIVYEGSLTDEDIEIGNIDENFGADLFDEIVWPTKESDVHVVVNESSPLADAPGASLSPLTVTVPDLEVGDYLATAVCVTDENFEQYAAAPAVNTFANAQVPLEMHFRNFSVSDGGILGSIDVFGSLGSSGS